MKIENTKVYGLMDSIRRSKYPMSTDIEECDINMTKTVKKLGKAKNGSGHDCFTKGVLVQADITAPQYWWLQYGRYHFSDITSSQSKMHRITKMDISKQCNKYVDSIIINHLESLVKEYNSLDIKEKNSDVGKILFQKIISNCPMGLNLTAGITSNYLQEKSIHSQRRFHKLEEWQYYCDWQESLPRFKELILGE